MVVVLVVLVGVLLVGGVFGFGVGEGCFGAAELGAVVIGVGRRFGGGGGGGG